MKSFHDYFTYFIVASSPAEPAFCVGKCSGGNKCAETSENKKKKI